MRREYVESMVIEKLFQIMFMSGFSFRYRLDFLSHVSDIWIAPVLTLTSSSILPVQLGLFRKLFYSLITEIHLHNCLSHGVMYSV